jgi:hypothetical protein
VADSCARGYIPATAVHIQEKDISLVVHTGGVIKFHVISSILVYSS